MNNDIKQCPSCPMHELPMNTDKIALYYCKSCGTVVKYRNNIRTILMANDECISVDNNELE